MRPYLTAAQVVEQVCNSRLPTRNQDAVWITWARAELWVPQAIRAIVAEYREDTDLLGEWLTQNTECDPDATVTVAAAFTDYADFCKAGHMAPGSKPSFSRAMTDRGMKRAPKTSIRRLMDFRLRPYHEEYPDFGDPEAGALMGFVAARCRGVVAVVVCVLLSESKGGAQGAQIGGFSINPYSRLPRKLMENPLNCAPCAPSIAKHGERRAGITKVGIILWDLARWPLQSGFQSPFHRSPNCDQIRLRSR